MTDLPDWLRPSSEAAPGTSARRRRGLSPARKALRSFSALLESMVRAEAVAARPGLLQRLDPRAKVVGLLSLVVAATLVHRLGQLAAVLGLGLLLAAASRVPLRHLMAAWLAACAFTAVLLAPAALNLVTEGRPVLVLWEPSSRALGPWRLPEVVAVTDAGLLVAARLGLRAAACVTLVSLLAATTQTTRLLRGLRALGVPSLFVLLLATLVRYLTVVLRAAEEVHLARLSRPLRRGPLRTEHRWLAAGIGSVYRRAMALGRDVHLAMLARGFAGEVRLLEEPGLRRIDWAFLAGIGAACALLPLL